MNNDKTFDDLARQKLEERALPYDPADWTAMERLLADERRRRRALWWRFAAGLILLLGGAAAYWIASDRGTPMAAAAPQAERSATNGKPEVPGETAAVPPIAGTPEPLNVIQPATAEGVDTRNKNESRGNDPTGPAHRKYAHPSRGGTRSNAEPEPNSVALNTAANPGSSPEPAAVTNDPLGATSGSINVHPAENLLPPPGDSEPRPTIASNPPVEPTNGPTTSNPSPPSGPAVVPASAASGSTVATASQASTTGTPPPADTASTSTPQRTAAATAFDLKLIGGAMRTRTRYGGVGAEEWGGASTANITGFCGLELFQMKEHWGWGAGLHVTSYAERLKLDERSNSFTTYQYEHTVNAVDTSIMTIVDTVVVDGTTYYVTQTMNTTIYVVSTELDSLLNTEVTRQAVERVNRSRYVEVPIMGDAHTACGRWLFGVQAGPVLQFRSTSSVVLPLDGNGTPVDAGTLPVRSWNLGAIVRPYARYRITGAWSLGIEPFWRGQLMNALEGDTRSMRSSGIGANAALVYRFGQ